MKKLTIAILVLLALTLAGCEDNRQDKTESGVSRNLTSEKITRFGHSYIYFYDGHGGYTPINVIHNPDCPCKKKGGEDERRSL